MHLASIQSIPSHSKHYYAQKDDDSIFRADCILIWLVDLNFATFDSNLATVDATNSWLDHISVVETLPNPSYARIDLLEASDLEQNSLKVARYEGMCGFLRGY